MMDFNTSTGATPLDPFELEALIPSHITTRDELNRWEQDNINEALAWVDKRKPKDILNESFIKQLHYRMFCHVWQWAGKLRQSEKNVGVSWHHIAIELKKLCDDVHDWIENRTFPEDELAARFHHRLVFIHPFSNGNGRHARLMTEILLENVLNKPPFTWGSTNLGASGDERKRYIEALIAADRGDFQPLLDFVRS